MPALIPQYIINHTVTAPVGIGPNETWDMCVISTPGDALFAVGYRALSPVDFRLQEQALPGPISPADQFFLVSQPSTITRTFDSVSVSVATGVINTAGCQSYGTPEDPTAFRITAKSLTAYSVGSELYNQGTVYAAQYSRRKNQTAGYARAPELGVGTTGGFVLCGSDAFDIPLDESDMAPITPGLYVAPAKEGAYIVHRLTGPTQEFVHKQAGPRFAQKMPGYAGQGSYYPTVGGLGVTARICDFVASQPIPDELHSSPYFNPFLSTNVGTLNTTAAVDNGHDDNCTIGIMIFRGLHPLQSITLKSVNAFEFIPSSDSASRNFVKLNPRADPNVMAVYYACAESLPDVMAARHNFLGSLIPALSSIASKALPFLRAVAPHVVPIANYAYGRLMATEEKPSAAAVAQAVEKGAALPGRTIRKKPKPKRVRVVVRSRSRTPLRTRRSIKPSRSRSR